MNKFVVYFRFEPYLSQWFIHEMGGTSPVELPRGSVEADILRMFLDKRPDDVPVDTGQDATLAIVIPSFKEKDAMTYNYLDASAIHCLHSCIRSRFDVQLWQDLHKVHPRMSMLKDLVEAWMVSHGIEFNDTNWCAVTKRYQRKRDTTTLTRRPSTAFTAASAPALTCSCGRISTRSTRG